MKLEFIVRQGKTVLQEGFYEGSWDASARAFIFNERRDAGVGLGGHGVPGAAAMWAGSQILKGADGCIYLRQRNETAGLGMLVLPVSTTQESWSRWEPVGS